MLYLFTATYPYGTAESFLEDEIIYLTNHFHNVTIVPLAGADKPVRNVPEGCKINTPILKSKRWKFFHGLFNQRTFWVYFSDAFHHKIFFSKTRLREWLASYFNTNCAISCESVRKIEVSLSERDICYFYWGKGLNTLSVFWDHKAKCVSRFHGEWDLWEESAGHYAPIRKSLVDHLDLAVFISQKGEEYFKQRYSQCKTLVSRLGSKDCGEGQRSTDGILRIVSCSSVWWLKRVPLIYQTLQEMSEKIIWTHIGAGEDFEKLKALVQQNMRLNISVELLGELKHDEVLQYYNSHPVDVFINVSTNEGIPVSIMEAISFNIPVVATDVGGTSEIVTPESGVLLPSNPTTTEIANAIRSSQRGNTASRAFWNHYYNAEKNYCSFANQLLSL